MPNYDELIQKSQENVKILSVKLKDLDKLHEDIKELLKQPELLGDKFQETVDLSKKYIDSIEDSAKKYLDGNNFLFTEKTKVVIIRFHRLPIANHSLNPTYTASTSATAWSLESPKSGR